MFELDVPGFKLLRLENIVLDFNGTISHDGKLIPEVADRLFELKENFAIFVVTADTFGTVKEQMKELAQIKILETTNHRDEKRAFVAQLGKDSVVAFGNGRNDVMMLKAASLGIAVCQGEGASSEVVHTADIVCKDNRIKNGSSQSTYYSRICLALSPSRKKFSINKHYLSMLVRSGKQAEST